MTDRSIALDSSAVAARDASVGDYFALLKPRVMSLVVFTGFTGLYLAPGVLHPVLAFTAVLCIALGAGASGAINMWYDRDIDVLMERTRKRPVADGRIEPGVALGFGVSLAAALPDRKGNPPLEEADQMHQVAAQPCVDLNRGNEGRSLGDGDLLREPLDPIGEQDKQLLACMMNLLGWLPGF